MGRWIAIDYGTKRVGIAVTDTAQLIATPLDTIHSKDILQYLEDYAGKEEVDGFVVGMPKKLDNTPSENAQHVVGFLRKLKKKFPDKEFQEADERFTSKMALDAMIAGGMKKKDRKEKGNVDKISATLILQSFLDFRK